MLVAVIRCTVRYMSKRPQLVETALRLFYRQGFHATGVDQLAREAGVTKKTLYNHFPTKEALVLAALRLRDEDFRARMERAVHGAKVAAGSPPGALAAARARAYLDFLLAWAGEHDFCGCAFINASAEYASADDPIHRLAWEHKRLVLEFLAQALGEGGAPAPEQNAQAVFLLGEGIIVAGQVGSIAPFAAAARAAATALTAGWSIAPTTQASPAPPTTPGAAPPAA
ncbi:transcriptional regulator, TetR family [Oryzomicrobium terrae]|uniref:Transcriptional regulator, TetR family n=2 Tax=Oryzomicrobium terrae TaxID=1735038 RepID=A0A5C1E6U4_9RHOO|nr:transcriptional regulator, TetR family [Oryzomicrobium terrae]